MSLHIDMSTNQTTTVPERDDDPRGDRSLRMASKVRTDPGDHGGNGTEDACDGDGKADVADGGRFVFEDNEGDVAKDCKEGWHCIVEAAFAVVV